MVEDGWWTRRRRLAAAGAGTLGVLVLWPACTIGPGLVWEGIAVFEPCDQKVEQEYGSSGEVRVIREDVHVEWFPPQWVCPLTNGDEVHP